MILERPWAGTKYSQAAEWTQFTPRIGEMTPSTAEQLRQRSTLPGLRR